MRAAAATTTAKTAFDSAVECLHCTVKMTPHLGSGGVIKYFHCPSCHRWVSSAYRDVFRADTNFRPIPERAEAKVAFDHVKDRLDRWLSALDDQDPYHLLGVSPLDNPERVRARYHELALVSHPDRGGSDVKMQQLNQAYEKILRHRQRRKLEALSAGAAEPSPLDLPARSR